MWRSIVDMQILRISTRKTADAHPSLLERSVDVASPRDSIFSPRSPAVFDRSAATAVY
jgi:hypothetical protein